ncbi:hypothetical protein [Paraburkholderia aromaticivorans]|uniref:hypothetical protein n=1 Tax=Paraburkholderia aromaticivorans TaxID=2026199 RepID=UPI00145616C0|nr:hypothetical protein [Paraburkholderia aromaticivorans]
MNEIAETEQINKRVNEPGQPDHDDAVNAGPAPNPSSILSERNAARMKAGQQAARVHALQPPEKALEARRFNRKKQELLNW